MHSNLRCDRSRQEISLDFKVDRFGILSLFRNVEFSYFAPSWFDFMFLVVMVQIAQQDKVEELLIFLSIPRCLVSISYANFISPIYPFSKAWILIWRLKVATIR
jgi:hypothetical protein